MTWPCNRRDTISSGQNGLRVIADYPASDPARLERPGGLATVSTDDGRRTVNAQLRGKLAIVGQGVITYLRRRLDMVNQQVPPGLRPTGAAPHRDRLLHGIRMEAIEGIGIKTNGHVIELGQLRFQLPAV